MSIINAVILGLVQGIAEFLPISSSGHLSILQNLFGM
ncbi:MAG: undecaprenyl-diphosphate phosphatase, partial [Oscillospiraceae bacterium]|nr:undecaprenyl-diphosphate phosphatase [Oscillospiraceae bacterium]